ncbi:MFS transporter [Pseudonocardia halophobica]|uniref:MFS transporter n=1 Tax=Pseudonocardia halophobica TaxID=29401 RepID=UPI003D90FCCB
MSETVVPPGVRRRHAHDRQDGRVRALLTACVGNTLEWFDWLVYAQFAALLATRFFPADSGSAALLGTLAIFGVGFFFRPLGGIVLAALADRRGRRTGLVVSMSMMAAGALIIGLAPSYGTVGLLAPLLLVLARALQGMSTGGEYAGAATYLAEYAPPGRRGRYGSLFYVSSSLGALAAIGVSLLLAAVLTTEQLNAWGWRLPFLLGGLLGVVALVMRRRMGETQAFTEARERRVAAAAPPSGARVLVREHKADLLRIVVIAGATGVWYYTFASYLPVYLQGRGLPAGQALAAGAVALVLMTVALPAVGILSDRIGRRPLLLAFSVVATLGAVPLFAWLEPTFGSQILVQTVALLGFGLYAAIGPVVMAEQFPTEVRALGAGLPYGLGLALFGGTAPLLIEWLADIGAGPVFPWYLAGLAALMLVATLTLRDRPTEDLRRV